jgi:hypothetical protein
MTQSPNPTHQPEALSALKRAMQTLADTIRRRQGAEQVREGIQRAMPDLQTVHIALHTAGTGCPECGWLRGHDYGCPRDPLNPAAPPASATPVQQVEQRQEAEAVAASEAWTRAMNAALIYRNADPEAIDEQDAWANLVKAIGALAAPPQAPGTAAEAVAWIDPETLSRLKPGGIIAATLAGCVVSRFTEPLYAAPQARSAVQLSMNLWIKPTKAGVYWKTEDPGDESWMLIEIPTSGIGLETKEGERGNG